MSSDIGAFSPPNPRNPILQTVGNQIVSNLNNVEILLTTNGALRGMCGWDEFHDRAVLWHPVPSPDGGLAEYPSWYVEPKKVTDKDISALQVYLQHLGLTFISKHAVLDALRLVGASRPWHPVKAYLDGLVWDGVERIGRIEGPCPSWLVLAAGSEDGPYVRTVGRISLIAMVARIYTPGCKYDYIPIFEGLQGAKKSTMIRVLSHPWFSDSLPCNIESKDASIHLQGLWAVEIGELSAFKRAALEELKRFITRQSEKYRPPYGTQEVEQPRSCVFFGTTNEKTYLSDTTGNRRFLPVTISKVDEAMLAELRDQLFAEAVSAFRAGEHWWVDAEWEEKYAAEQQASRMDDDPWADKIMAYVKNRKKLTYSVIAEMALGLDTKGLNNYSRDRIKGVMVQAGWETAKIGGVCWWVKKEEKKG